MENITVFDVFAGAFIGTAIGALIGFALIFLAAAIFERYERRR